MKVFREQLLKTVKNLLSIKRKRCQYSFPVPFDGTPDVADRGIYAADPLDPDKRFPEPRVIIIGAGLAGISAAAKLSERGINNYVVLEANSRPGGRIQSCWLGDSVVELGASWKPPTTNKNFNPIYNLTLSENPPRPASPGSEHPKGLLDSLNASTMDYAASVNAYLKFRQIEKEAHALYCMGGNKQHGSLLHFMSLRIQQELHDFPENHQQDAARIMFGLTHTLTARCGEDTNMIKVDNAAYYMNLPGGSVRVPLGTIGILAPLLKQVKGEIRYCMPVNCIYWGTTQKSGPRAVVCTCVGEEFPADYVIITVPLGNILCNTPISFCPDLPASKMDAVRRFGIGHYNKIYFEYARPYFYWHEGDINLKFCQGELNFPTAWANGVTSIELVPNSKRVICITVCGMDAVMMEGVCDRDLAEDVTQIMRYYLGNSCIPYPVNILRSQWSSNRYFNGAFVYDFCATCGEAERALSEPLPGYREPVPPILLFAGEATVPGHSSMLSGARLSGIREAERVVQLTLLFEGPPLSECCPCTLQAAQHDAI